MNVKYLLSLITGVVECLLFSGILFGWSSIRYVLEKEGYFSDLCQTPQNNETDISSTTRQMNYSNMISTTTVSMEEANSSSYSVFPGTDAIVRGFWNRSKQSSETTIFITSTSVADPTAEKSSYPTCDEQSERLNLVFTIASTLLSFSTLINGYIYDKFGTWISRVIAIILFTAGCIMMTVSSYETSWLLFPAFSCFAIGGILMLVTNLQIGNLFGRFRSSVITMLSGALDSSSFVFLLFKILYEHGVELGAIFHATAWATVFLWLRTFLLLPRRHIPFPLTKNYNYGLANCRSDKQAGSSERELKPMKNKKEEEEEMITPAVETVQAVEQEIPIKRYTSCVKTVRFWSNMAHFSFLQLRNYFFLNTLIDWLKPLTKDDETLSSYLVAFGTCQLFGVLFAPLNGLLIDISIRYLMKKPNVFKDIVPLKAVVFSGIATSLLGTLFSVTVAIPSLQLQYVSFLLQVVFRSFLYGGNMSFIAIAFPGQHFGKLYGLTMTLGGVISLLQYPLFSLVTRYWEGDFLAINIIFVFVSLLTLLHPAHVFMYCKKKEKEHDSSILK